MCLSVRSHISKTTRPTFTKFYVHVDCGRGSVLFWRRCDTLCTSGIVDNVILPKICVGPAYSYKRRERNRLNYCPDSNQILLSDKNRQVHVVRCAPEAKSVIYGFLVFYTYVAMNGGTGNLYTRVISHCGSSPLFSISDCYIGISLEVAPTTLWRLLLADRGNDTGIGVGPNFFVRLLLI